MKTKTYIYKNSYFIKILKTMCLMICFVIVWLAAFPDKTNAVIVVSLSNPHKNYTYNYKGNMHAHSEYGPSDGNTNNDDDGVDLRADVGAWYAGHGFKFYTLTPHFNPFYDYSASAYVSSPVADPLNAKETLTPDPGTSGVVWMGSSIENSIAVDTTLKNCAHVGQLNLPSGTTYAKTINSKIETIGLNTQLGIRDNPQQVINNVVSSTSGSIFNHPHYNRSGSKTSTCANTTAAGKIQLLDNLLGVEIFNSSVENESSGDGLATDTWDSMMLAGKPVWGFAADDGHNAASRGGGFIVVNSSSSNPDKNELWSNIQSGNFYSSTPLSIAGTATNNYYNLNITTSGATVTASTTNGSKLRFIADGGVVYTTAGQSGSYSASQSQRYIRVEVLNSSNLPIAWSQPIKILLTDVPDTTPPSVSLTAPSGGATVSGSSSAVSATASDNVGVSRVAFYIDSSLINTDYSSPYSYSWDTTAYSNGSYTVRAVAYDAAGNSASSSTITVSVNNVASPPPSGGGSPALTFIAMEEPRWMEVGEDVYKSLLTNNSYVDDKLTKGRQLKFSTKAFLNGVWYLRTQYDANAGLLKAIPLSKLRDLQFVAFETPRFMNVISSTYKTYPKTGIQDISVIQKDTQLRFTSKILVNDVWYYRTEYDHVSGLSKAMNASSVSDITYSNIAPVSMKLSRASQKVRPSTGGLTGEVIQKNSSLYFSSKTCINGVWYYRTQYDTIHGLDKAIVRTDLYS